MHAMSCSIVLLHSPNSSALIPSFFFFTHTATTEIYTLSLHDALPICAQEVRRQEVEQARQEVQQARQEVAGERSEEHTSELQSHSDIVCRLLLEKKKSNSTANKTAPLILKSNSNRSVRLRIKINSHSS